MKKTRFMAVGAVIALMSLVAAVAWAQQPTKSKPAAPAVWVSPLQLGHLMGSVRLALTTPGDARVSNAPVLSYEPSVWNKSWDPTRLEWTSVAIVSGPCAKITGQAPDPVDVAEFLQRLNTIHELDTPQLISVQSLGDTLTFEMSVCVPPVTRPKHTGRAFKPANLTRDIHTRFKKDTMVDIDAFMPQETTPDKVSIDMKLRAKGDWKATLEILELLGELAPPVSVESVVVTRDVGKDAALWSFRLVAERAAGAGK